MSPPVHTIRSFCKIKVVSQYQLSEGILGFLPLSLPLQLPCTHTNTHRHVRTTTTNTCTCVASSLPSVSYWAHALCLTLLLFSSPRLIQARCAHSVLRVPSPAHSLLLSCLFSFYLQLVPGAHSRLEQVALPLNCNKTTTTSKMLYAILICIKSCFVCVLQTVSFLIFSNTIFGICINNLRSTIWRQCLCLDNVYIWCT